MKSNILIESNISDLSPGDHIFSADFVSDEKNDRLEIKEYEFVKYLTGNNNSEIEVNKDSIPAEIFDIRFPKIHSKTDISYGFFATGEQAAKEFVDMITHIYKIVKKSYKEFVNI